MNNNSILLVLLNKNEELGLIKLLPQINKRLFKEIICIDGASNDNSISVLKEFGIKVLSQNSTGRGAAFKIALNYARNNDFEYIIFFSTDGNEDPEDLSKFIELFNLNPDLIIASRMLPGAYNEEDDKFFRPRKFGNKTFSLIAWLLFSRKAENFISDPINGFRAIKFSTWKNIELKSNSFSIEFEISIKAYKNNFDVIEFETFELNRISGKSGAKAVRTSMSMLKIIAFEILNKK